MLTNNFTIKTNQRSPRTQPVDQVLDLLIEAKETTAIANLLQVRPASIPKILNRRKRIADSRVGGSNHE